ncbi:MAG: hypothetical protein Q7S03_02255 [bacterium]|nr:hypothetical protein [bacterium]
MFVKTNMLGKSIPNPTGIIWQDKFAQTSFVFAFLFWLTSLSLLFFFWAKLPPQIPLFYSRPWGEEQLAPQAYIFLLPSSIFIFLLLDFLSSFALKGEKLVLRILSATCLACAFLGLFSLIRILELSL